MFFILSLRLYSSIITSRPGALKHIIDITEDAFGGAYSHVTLKYIKEGKRQLIVHLQSIDSPVLAKSSFSVQVLS